MSASCRIRWTVPTSLLAHITLVSATSSDSASSSTSGWTRPRSSTGSHVTEAPSCATSHSMASSTAWCSTADARMRVRPVARRAQKMPLTARLSLSVPPAVKTTSEGRAPSAKASDSRDSSTTRRARRPVACSELALPTSRIASETAATASGSMGVEAAWSR